MLSYLFGQAIQRLQPLVFLDDGVYVKTLQGRGSVTLETALGIEHLLKRLCSDRTLVEHFRRHNRSELLELFQRG